MANTNMLFESLLAESGLQSLKTQLDNLIANPADTATMLFPHLVDLANDQLSLPVSISKENATYVIQSGLDLVATEKKFLLNTLESKLKEFKIVLNDAATAITEFKMEAEAELQNIKQKVTDELAKIPFRVEIEQNGANKVFSVQQTQPIEAKFQGLEFLFKTSSLKFDAENISQLSLTADAILKGVQNEAGTDHYKTEITISFVGGRLEASANNSIPAKLQGLSATITNFNLIIENNTFMPGTLVAGKLVFDFLDAGQNGFSEIGFGVTLQNNGDVRYEAQNPQGKELKKGSISLFFEEISVLTHTAAPTEVSINGWAQLSGLIDKNKQLPARANFAFAYLDPYFEFSGGNFSNIPLGFGDITFEEVFLRIHKNGNIQTNTWNGNLGLPAFNNGRLDFNVDYQNDALNLFVLTVNNSANLPIKYGNFELFIHQYEMVFEQGIVKEILGDATLVIPNVTSGTPITTLFKLVAQQEVTILAQNIGLQTLAGAQLTFNEILFRFLNGNLTTSHIIGKLSLPDATGGAGLAFAIQILNNGADYGLALTGAPDTNTLQFGPIGLSIQTFVLQVVAGALQNVGGSGTLQLPGMQSAFTFNFLVANLAANPSYSILLNDVNSNIGGFTLNFSSLSFTTQQGGAFNFSANGLLKIPLFQNNGFNFTVDVGRNNTYNISVNGAGQSANFGAIALHDLVFVLAVDNGVVQNAIGSAKIHIPEITNPAQPCAVALSYKTTPNEEYLFSANGLPDANLSVFTLKNTNLDFLIRDGSFESGHLSGSVVIPVFSGGGVNYNLAIQSGGNDYAATIVSTNTLTAGGLELKDINLNVAVVGGALQTIGGTANFKIPAASDFTSVTVNYSAANQQLNFSASSLPQFAIGGLTFNFSAFGFGLKNGSLVDANFAGQLTIPVCDAPNNKLDFDFTLTTSNSYTIHANPGGTETNLKLGEVTLHVGTFNLQISSGQLASIAATAGLSFAAFTEENNPNMPARFNINFSYNAVGQVYTIGLKQNKKVKIGGFGVTLKTLALAFTPTSLSYPFHFDGDLEIPGLEAQGGGQAVLGVKFIVPSANNFEAQITSNGVFTIGSTKVSITTLGLTKNLNDYEIKLGGTIELEHFSGMGGSPAKLNVDIEIDSNGSFSVLGQATPSVKVVDVPNMVRIYLSKLGLSRTQSNTWDFTLGGLIENLIVIPSMENLLPSQLNIAELKVGSDFNLALDIRWPSGLSISFGGAQSEAIIPINGKFGNTVSLDALKIGFINHGNAGADLSISLSGASIMLGPVTAAVEGLGVVAKLTKPTFNAQGKPTSPANFGVVNLDIEFKPPTGLGISLQTPVFTGGGYLFYDNDKGEYAGAVELRFMNMFAVSAIGIINSKMPDGQPGTSVLFIMSVEFSPGIALGFGFFLSGLGGIIGIHRTMQVDRLREGVSTGTIQNILFPQNIIANIGRILTDIKEVFPVKRDQFVIGPMAAITWGVPAILRVDLGLAIEFANPVRFAILGVIRVVLPTEEAALIKIQVAFLGVIDFEKGMLSFDASLFDSRILTFGLEGDMALRLSWGAQKDFVMSVGGFHPSYKPPTYLQLPSMKRLTIKILSGNPRLTLTSYFAITTNTVQFGAGIDFYFKVSKFKVVGDFGFDVLFQFSPFRFIADAHARLAVKAGSTTLFSITLVFTLEGPTPWRAKGKASFKVLFFKVTAKFDITWGERRDTALPDINVLPLLLEALNENQNWRSVTGITSIDGLRMRAIATEEDDLILTPNGTIELVQKIVPLAVEINKFGQFKPADFTKFDIDDVDVGSTQGTFSYIDDTFAPANFLEIGDKDKLALPSFHTQHAGVKVSAAVGLKCGTVVDRKVEYEQSLMDEVNNNFNISMLLGKSTFQQRETTFFSRTGAVGQMANSANKAAIFNPAKVVLNKPSYAVVNNSSLGVVASGLSYMAAQETLSKTKKPLGAQLVTNDILSK